ncbi:MAG TPA: hypothetical protein VGO18_39745 [Steroidobacteraceae bacterium]|jgi:hypothetical protein|nr:hypothetical protein [Steroidobacteraceae bacterium]
MRAIKFFTVSVAASPLLRTVAHASDAAGVSEGSAGKSEVVKTAGLPWNVEDLPTSLAGETPALCCTYCG